jgi:hypothetical protein
VYHRTARILSHPVLAAFRMEDKITEIRKPVHYIRGLKGLWPIRAREGEDGVYTLRNSVTLRKKATGFPETTEKKLIFLHGVIVQTIITLSWFSFSELLNVRIS